MTRPHKLGALVTAIVLTLATQAASGDPTPTTPVVAAAPAAVPAPAATPTPITTPPTPGTMHLQTPSTVVTDGGSNLRLPPGYFLPESEYARQDALLKSMGNQVTDLSAQNVSLRASASGWQPGWKTLAASLVTGIVLGIYVDHRYF